jgi:hypothetical protein
MLALGVCAGVGRLRAAVGTSCGGLSCGLCGEVAADRVEVDQSGGPGSLQSGLRGSEVAALAGAVTSGEQAEQPLDPGPGASQVLGRDGIVEGLAGGDQEFFVGRDQHLPLAAGRRDAAIT